MDAKLENLFLKLFRDETGNEMKDITDSLDNDLNMGVSSRKIRIKQENIITKKYKLINELIKTNSESQKNLAELLEARHADEEENFREAVKQLEQLEAEE